MERVLPFLFLLAAGNILRRIPLFPADTDRSLNLYVIYVALPALILVQAPKLAFTTELLAPVLMAWLAVLCSSLLVFGVSRLCAWPRAITGSLLLMVPLGNTAFLGIPMVELFYGGSGLTYAILYDQFGSFLALSTYGAVILALYSDGKRPTPGRIAARIVLFPPFIALAAALVLRGASYPPWAAMLLQMTADSLVPVVMVAIGFQLRLRMVSAERLPLLFGLTARLLLTPLLFIAACMLLGLTGSAIQVSLFETAMPPMVAAGALASMAGLSPRLSSAMVGYGILASFMTLPLLYRLIAFLD